MTLYLALMADALLDGLPARRPEAEISVALNYGRHPVAFGAPGSDGFGASTGAITFGAPQSTPAFAAPNDHPNAWYVVAVALCTGPTAGVADQIAVAEVWRQFRPTDVAESPLSPVADPFFGDNVILPGESLSFAAAAVRYNAATGALQATLSITPTRGQSNFFLADGKTPNPCFHACWYANFLSPFNVAHAQWLSARAAYGSSGQGAAAVAQAQSDQAVAVARAATCGCS